MKYTLNLSTREYVDRRRLYGLYAGLGVALVLLLLLNLNNLMRSQGRYVEVERRLAEERAKQPAISAFAGDGAAVQGLSARIDFANRLLKRDGFRWTALLDRLEAHLVPGIGGIERIQPDYKTGQLEIAGRAASLGVLRHFIGRLLTSPDIETVYLRNQALIDEEGEGAEISFTIELKLKEVGE